MSATTLSPSVPSGARNDKPAEGAADAPERLPLFIIPCSRGDGFRASIRGHQLELADPSSGQDVAPTPDDLRVAAIASDFAWFARRFLRDRGLDDYVSVTARLCVNDRSPGLDHVDMALTVSEGTDTGRITLTAALEREFAGTFRNERVQLRVGTT